MSILDMLRRPVAKATATDTSRDLEKARTDLVKAEAEIATAQAAYDGSLLDEDITTCTKARSRLSDAEIARDRGKALVTALEDRLAAVTARDAEDKRKTAYAEAKASAAEFKARLAREYPSHAEAIVTLLRDGAAVEDMVERANADLPAEAELLRSPEMELRSKRRSETITNERVVNRWTYQNGNALDEERIAKVDRISKYSGKLDAGIANGSSISVRDNPFLEVSYIPADKRPRPDPLWRQIVLPGLYGGVYSEPPEVWKSASPADHLARLTAERNEHEKLPEPKVRYESLTYLEARGREPDIVAV